MAFLNASDNSLIISKHLKSNFVRPQALIRTASSSTDTMTTVPSDTPPPTLQTSTIVIIHLTVVGIFCLLIALGFYIYRRQMRALPNYNATSTLSKTENSINLSKETLSTIDEKVQPTSNIDPSEEKIQSMSINNKKLHGIPKWERVKILFKF